MINTIRDLYLENILISNGSVHNISKDKNIEKIKNSSRKTIIIKYTSNECLENQSLFSISDKTKQSYFHLYISNSGKVCMEFINQENSINHIYSMPSVLRGKYKGKPTKNTLAIAIDDDANLCKLFANGKLIINIQDDNLIKIKDICDMDNVVLGGVLINNNILNQFTGEINYVEMYSNLLEDEFLLKATKNEIYGNEIFYCGDSTNASYFRIPSLYTLKSGTVVSAIDARYGGTHDSWSKINIAFSRSIDNGQSWSNQTLPFEFSDYKNQMVTWPRDMSGKELRIRGSASFIDSVLLEDAKNKRLLLFADAMPFGVGAGNCKLGSGYKTINNKNYIKLHHKDDKIDVYNYSIRENGIIYDDIKNSSTTYKIDGNYNLICDDTYVLQKQYQIRFDKNELIEEQSNTLVKTNVFYKDCPFTLFRTSFLVMKYSDDEGITWSDMQILNLDANIDNRNPLYSPARGLQTKTDRLLLNAYLHKDAKFGVLISDDGALTWRYNIIELQNNIVFTEAQTVELLDGTLITYSRTNKSKIGFIKSIDNGETWTKGEFIENIHLPSYGTQLSIINYSHLIDNKQAIILSTPTCTNGRKDGKIYIGLVNPSDNSIDWKYKYSVDLSTYGYSYSCLTELANGDIGVLYEKYDSWARDELHLKDTLKFDIYTLKELMVTN